MRGDADVELGPSTSAEGTNVRLWRATEQVFANQKVQALRQGFYGAVSLEVVISDGIIKEVVSQVKSKIR